MLQVHAYMHELQWAVTPTAYQQQHTTLLHIVEYVCQHMFPACVLRVCLPACVLQDCWAPVPEQRPGFDVVVARLSDLLQQLQHAEVTATAAAAANRAAAAITAAAGGTPLNTSG
jgi:hypothetical protein